MELSNRRGQLFVRVDAKPWTFYVASGDVASTSIVQEVLGRQSTTARLIQEKIDSTVSLRRAPKHGNPYGRFPEDTEVGILGSYSDMDEVDFTELSDGLGLRILDEGFIEIYGGFPDALEDEWGHKWIRLSTASEYRPWAIYVKTVQPAMTLPAADLILAAAKTAKLPDVKPLPVQMVLTFEKLKVISLLDRKTFDLQKKVMKNNSAREVAILLGLPDVGWEWLHLVAFSLGGHLGEAQIPQNLVIGTEAANTHMMLIEQFVKEEVESRRYESVTIVVSRMCPVPTCCWFASNIKYAIKFTFDSGVPPKYVREEFNPLLRDAPGFVVKQMREQIKGFRSGRPPVPVSDTMRKPTGPRGRRL